MKGWWILATAVVLQWSLPSSALAQIGGIGLVFVWAVYPKITEVKHPAKGAQDTTDA